MSRCGVQHSSTVQNEISSATERALGAPATAKQVATSKPSRAGAAGGGDKPPASTEDYYQKMAYKMLHNAMLGLCRGFSLLDGLAMELESSGGDRRS